jgi:Transmembrane protein 65
MIINALPFVGFGFLDNFTMIIAGDYIEHTLGIFMSISTMAAAALGKLMRKNYDLINFTIFPR